MNIHLNKKKYQKYGVEFQEQLDVRICISTL